MKFKTSDDLPFNKKIKVSVCVISISSFFQCGEMYYPQIVLQDCFYENENIYSEDEY